MKTSNSKFKKQTSIGWKKQEKKIEQKARWKVGKVRRREEKEGSPQSSRAREGRKAG